jgi:hypothetical protein
VRCAIRALAEASGKLEILLGGVIVQEAKTDARIALEFLEQRHPQRWRKTTGLEHTGPAGGPVEHRIIWDIGQPPIETTATKVED